MITEGFRTLKPGGTGTFSSSSLTNIEELMRVAGFINIEKVGLAPRTIYNGIITQPAIEYRGTKP
jgi:hypothetical protein